MPPKPKDKPSPLGEFILANAQSRNIPLSTVASTLGISRSYLSEIVYQNIPSPEVLNKIADFFQASRLQLYNLVGWIEIEDDSEFLNQMTELAKNDPDFVELLKIYAQCTTPYQRQRLLRIIRASIE